MSSIAPLNVPALLREFSLRPDKRLGQNYLISENALQRIVAAAEIEPSQTVLEIGPGVGSLTRHLAAAARQVTAVELDERLLPALERVLEPVTNVRVVIGDILALQPAMLVDQPEYLVVANLPYYITSAAIRHLVEAQPRPARMVLTVQLEVAERICAEPGKMSLLALSVQMFGQPQIKARLPAGAFYPTPKVDSAVVRVDLYAQPQLPESQLDLFFRLAKAGFAQKRKTLRNALAAGMAWDKTRAAAHLKDAGIDQKRRAETLSIAEWGKLVDQIEKKES